MKVPTTTFFNSHSPIPIQFRGQLLNSYGTRGRKQEGIVPLGLGCDLDPETASWRSPPLHSPLYASGVAMWRASALSPLDMSLSLPWVWIKAFAFGFGLPSLSYLVTQNGHANSITPG